jgi:hypothetical protein
VKNLKEYTLSAIAGVAFAGGAFAGVAFIASCGGGGSVGVSQANAGVSSSVTDQLLCNTYNGAGGALEPNPNVISGPLTCYNKTQTIINPTFADLDTAGWKIASVGVGPTYIFYKF